MEHKMCRQKHDQQLLEMRELMEAGKTAQTEAMLAQRRQMEAEMRSSLCMLEEQAAKHVRSVQQNFTMAQSHAAEKEHECNHLNDRYGQRCVKSVAIVCTRVISIIQLV